MSRKIGGLIYLFEAIARNDAAEVQRVLRNGTNVHCYNDCDADTPLTLACRKGYDNIVRILLDSGANPWMMSSDHSSVEAAIDSGQVSNIEWLLNHDNDLLEAKCPRIGGIPLLAAI